MLTTWSAGLVADKTIDLPREKQLLFKNLIGSGAFVVSTEDYGKKYVLIGPQGLQVGAAQLGRTRVRPTSTR